MVYMVVFEWFVVVGFVYLCGCMCKEIVDLLCVVYECYMMFVYLGICCIGLYGKFVCVWWLCVLDGDDVVVMFDDCW